MLISCVSINFVEVLPLAVLVVLLQKTRPLHDESSWPLSGDRGCAQKGFNTGTEHNPADIQHLYFTFYFCQSHGPSSMAGDVTLVPTLSMFRPDSMCRRDSMFSPPKGRTLKEPILPKSHLSHTTNQRRSSHHSQHSYQSSVGVPPFRYAFTSPST